MSCRIRMLTRRAETGNAKSSFDDIAVCMARFKLMQMWSFVTAEGFRELPWFFRLWRLEGWKSKSTRLITGS